MRNVTELFQKQHPTDITDNFFRAIGQDWLLITAGTSTSYNTMTASWGTMGVFWNKPISICFVRPTRHTFQFINNSEVYTLSFFTSKEREILQFCGSKSGRDVDKIAETGLIPLITEYGGIGFEQSRLIVECKKIYFDDLKSENFLLPNADTTFYPKKDYHRVFYGEILNCYSCH